MPTDMCALQDFEEPDKLHIQVNDVITIIEGRWVCLQVFFFFQWHFRQEFTKVVHQWKLLNV